VVKINVPFGVMNDVEKLNCILNQFKHKNYVAPLFNIL